MNLVKVDEREIAGELVQTVSARDLYNWLEVGRDFSNWIKGRIEEYGFIEGEDFTPYKAKSTGGRPSIEYYITISMAKELGMIENNAKGKDIRRYFIRVEREYKLDQKRKYIRDSVEWQQARLEGKVARRVETDTIKEFVEYATKQGSSNAKFYYSLLTKGTYKALFILEKGADVKNMRERLGLLQLQQLAVAENLLQEKIAEFMRMNIPYKDIYKLALAELDRLVEILGKQLPGIDTSDKKVLNLVD